MIILAIIALSAVVLTLVFAALGGIPALPDAVTTYAALAIKYIGDGCSILYQFCYRDVVVGLLAVTLTLTVVYNGYKFVMWVVKKIPMFGVSD